MYEEIIKENIEYDCLVERDRVNKYELDELVTLIVDTVAYERRSIRVGGREVPYQEVKSRLLKLNRSHIEYVLESLSANCTHIKDTYSYNLTTLFNAPVTIDSYYRGLVNYHMYGADS